QRRAGGRAAAVAAPDKGESMSHQTARAIGRGSALALGAAALLVAASGSALSAPQRAPPAPAPATPATATVTVRADIDGRDVVHVRGTQVSYVHRNWQLPGRWNGHNEATYIDGAAWMPTWNGSGTGATSDMYDLLAPPLAASGTPQFEVTSWSTEG